MKTYRILEVVTRTYAFDVEARDEKEAIDKIERSCGGITADISRCPEYDNEVWRGYECEGDG